jgi:hypothetical protein
MLKIRYNPLHAATYTPPPYFGRPSLPVWPVNICIRLAPRQSLYSDCECATQMISKFFSFTQKCLVQSYASRSPSFLRDLLTDGDTTASIPFQKLVQFCFLAGCFGASAPH